jgi:hypothetical protein
LAAPAGARLLEPPQQVISTSDLNPVSVGCTGIFKRRD